MKERWTVAEKKRTKLYTRVEKDTQKFKGGESFDKPIIFFEWIETSREVKASFE